MSKVKKKKAAYSWREEDKSFARYKWFQRDDQGWDHHPMESNTVSLEEAERENFYARYRWPAKWPPEKDKNAEVKELIDYYGLFIEYLNWKIDEFTIQILELRKVHFPSSSLSYDVAVATGKPLTQYVAPRLGEYSEHGYKLQQLTIYREVFQEELERVKKESANKYAKSKHKSIWKPKPNGDRQNGFYQFLASIFHFRELAGKKRNDLSLKEYVYDYAEKYFGITVENNKKKFYDKVLEFEKVDTRKKYLKPTSNNFSIMGYVVAELGRNPEDSKALTIAREAFTSIEEELT